MTTTLMFEGFEDRILRITKDGVPRDFRVFDSHREKEVLIYVDDDNHSPAFWVGVHYRWGIWSFSVRQHDFKQSLPPVSVNFDARNMQGNSTNLRVVICDEMRYEFRIEEAYEIPVENYEQDYERHHLAMDPHRHTVLGFAHDAKSKETGESGV